MLARNKLNSNILLALANPNRIEIDISRGYLQRLIPSCHVFHSPFLSSDSWPPSVTFSLVFSLPDTALDPSGLLVVDSWLLGLDSFFHFIRLFWNQVLTWVSFNPSVCASFARFDVSKYFCSANVFSKTRSWRSVKTVRDLRHLRPLGVLRVGLTRKYTGSWLRTSGLGSAKKPRITPSRKREDSLWLMGITKSLRCVDTGLKSSQDFKGCFVTTKASNRWSVIEALESYVRFTSSWQNCFLS